VKREKRMPIRLAFFSKRDNDFIFFSFVFLTRFFHYKWLSIEAGGPCVNDVRAFFCKMKGVESK